VIGAAMVLCLSVGAAPGHSTPCAVEADAAEVAAAVARMRAGRDPCGESAQLVAVLDKLERCGSIDHRICVDPESGRNSFDRPSADPAALRTITWNPSLQTALELGCDGDASRPVRRDATASLLHELAHAAQDCDGLEPGELEFEAVRVENIYRRAAGLCQRYRYGDTPLPPEMIKVCEPGACPCTSPLRDGVQADAPHVPPSAPGTSRGLSADGRRSADP
jgi:hypothetical protein